MRLTHKFGNEYDIINDNRVRDFKKDYQGVTNKLGQLEDIEEEELGIELITLYKAQKNGFYAKPYYDNNGHIKDQKILHVGPNAIAAIYIEEDGIYFMDVELDTEIYLKSYGLTWALTKKELL